MIRYRLDDLGWYQFEWLVQSLLKAEIGLAVQSWGGRSDLGRDAYYAGPLNFPLKHQTSEGPFLFQAKFVESANAAGSSPDNILLNAVRKEATQLKTRSEDATWEKPRHYILLTNAPISGNLRDQIQNALQKAIAGAEVHPLGGADLCDLLDRHVTLRRSFPQLLSLRDLDTLLQDAVSKDTLERSRSAVECARDIVSVFVPTSAYNRAWMILRKHHFAMLEGPPEMGKTAIAWTIALAQLSQGWQAVVCDEPGDLFRCYSSNSRQVFVADDAFGRTEYDPSRGGKWEGQLDRVFRLHDRRHWLIWTSRKHILERARKAMDLQGKASNFPNPGAVLVDASELSTEEKALILYRHARAAGLEEKAKELVRKHARLVVSDNHFTPERIRRFVSERLPALVSEMASGQLDPYRVSIEIRDAIRNPTDRMKKSFRALPPPHKWLLISLLEVGYWPSPTDLRGLYEAHCPAEARKPYAEVFDELTESFVKSARLTHLGREYREYIDWVHPSYRDLVIEELLNDPHLHAKFLQEMTLEGVKLAVSESGGPTGERRFPLMISDQSWRLLHDRCIQLTANSSAQEIAEIMDVLRNAALQASDTGMRDHLVAIISSVCEQARKGWNQSSTLLQSSDLRAYCEASLLVSPLAPFPRLDASWKAMEENIRGLLEKSEGGKIAEPELVNEWVEFVMTIQKNEPRFLVQVGYPEKYTGEITRLLDIIEDDLRWHSVLDSAEALREEAKRFSSIAETLGELSTVVTTQRKRAEKLVARLKGRSSSLEEEANALEPPERDEEDFSRKEQGDSFDIEGLFSDL